MSLIEQTEQVSTLQKEYLGQAVGVLILPRSRHLHADEWDRALHAIQSSSYSWVVLGGDSSCLHALAATQKVQRLGNAELMSGQSSINETARLWASQWSETAQAKEIFQIAGCNVGRSLYRESAYCFLGVLKQAYFLTSRLSRGTLAQCLVLEEEGWKEIAPDKMLDRLPLLIARSCGVRRMVIEEDKSGWRLDLKRRLWWLRNVLERLRSRAPGKGSVLISSNPKVALPVMRELSSVGHALTILRPLLGFKPLWDAWKNRHAFRVYRNYWDAGLRQEVAAHHARILEAKGQWEESVRRSHLFEFAGRDWWEVVQPQFKYYFSEYFPTLIGYALLSEALLKKEKIRGILVDEDVCEFNRTLVTVAEAIGIPSVVLQHGAPFELQPTGLSPVSATKIAAWGRYSEELLRRWGVPAEKIVRTGVPRYDSIRSEDVFEAKRKVRAATRWNGHMPLLVYACDPYHREGREDYVGIPSSQKEEEEALLCFLDGLASLSDAFGIIKLHPKDQDDAWVQRLLDHHPGRCRVAVLKLFPTITLLAACDALVTGHSTVAIEAMLLGKPVCTVNCTGWPDLQPHAQLGAAITVREKNRMGLALAGILHNADLRNKLAQSAQRALQYYMEAVDGKASARVAQLLDERMGSPG